MVARNGRELHQIELKIANETTDALKNLSHVVTPIWEKPRTRTRSSAETLWHPLQVSLFTSSLCFSKGKVAQPKTSVNVPHSSTILINIGAVIHKKSAIINTIIYLVLVDKLNIIPFLTLFRTWQPLRSPLVDPTRLSESTNKSTNVVIATHLPQSSCAQVSLLYLLDFPSHDHYLYLHL